VKAEAEAEAKEERNVKVKRIVIGEITMHMLEQHKKMKKE
jgi:hypothetical protein